MTRRTIPSSLKPAFGGRNVRQSHKPLDVPRIAMTHRRGWRVGSSARHLRSSPKLGIAFRPPMAISSCRRRKSARRRNSSVSRKTKPVSQLSLRQLRHGLTSLKLLPSFRAGGNHVGRAFRERIRAPDSIILRYFNCSRQSFDSTASCPRLSAHSSIACKNSPLTLNLHWQFVAVSRLRGGTAQWSRFSPPSDQRGAASISGLRNLRSSPERFPARRRTQTTN
jgi:hypothetical protein